MWLKAKTFGGLSLLLVDILEILIYTHAKFSLWSDVTYKIKLMLSTSGKHVQKPSLFDITEQDFLNSSSIRVVLFVWKMCPLEQAHEL